MTNSKRLATTVTFVALSFVLSACSSSPTPSPSPTGAVVSSSTSHAAMSTPPDPGWNVAKDAGPGHGANGQVETDATGVPIHYTVASGDTEGAICKRLGVRWWQLQTVSGTFLGTYPELQINEVLKVVDVPESEAIAAGRPTNNPLC